ncbi:flagellar motor switch phosphatase FliY [Bacillus spongiae]|uniref:Flagellar motor switch protein FliN n=1 Tax=Bacillus spongiae TaxID=2683610 RepID=A0ABU8HA59_9BACI
MMSDMLSQDEIDALLNGTEDNEMENQAMNIVENYLSSFEQDTLGEIGNISFGSSATALSTLLNQKVEITTPTVAIIDHGKLKDEFPHPYVAIQVQYTEGFIGSNLLVIKQSDAAIIADLMLGGDGLNPSDNLGEIQLSAVQEAMNQMMGSAATSMSTVFAKKVDISPPVIDLMYVPEGRGTENIPNQDLLVKVSFSLKIGTLIDSNIMQLVPLSFAKSLVNELTNKGNQQTVNSVNNNEETPEETVETSPPPMETGKGAKQEPQFATQPRAASGPQHFGGATSGGNVQVQPAAFTSFETPQLQEHEVNNLNMLLDIPLQVTVELGRTKRSVKDILALSAGSIIELDKLAGEPVDILVNSRLIAKGEVVVIDENFGVRITDIVSQSERLNQLK